MTKPLWRWPELCRALGVPEVAGPDVTGISIDTRSAASGDLFIALAGDPGPRFGGGGGGRDGHDFLGAAEAAGVAGALVRHGAATSLAKLEVTDTLDGLWALGRAARERVDAAVIAVTGSAGKTTARQWLETILMAQANAHASTGSLNNHWGVPLSLTRMPADVRFGVFEIGTNHPGEIAPLSRLVGPDVSILLNVLPAHIGNFDNLDALRVEKLSIEAGLRERGTLIVPEELDLSGALTRNVLTFGQTRGANIFGKARYSGGGADVTVRIGGRSWDYRLSLPGEHRVLTSLAVFGGLFAIDADLDRALPVFERLTVPKGRGNASRVGDITVIDDSYNANPVSMRLALEVLAAEEGRRIAILGEMLELGSESHGMHMDIAAACRGLDGVITVGDGFRDLGAALGNCHWEHVDSADDIDLDDLKSRLDGPATLLVKGSNKVFWTRGFVDRLTASLGSH